jgi:hypothetical protein
LSRFLEFSFPADFNCLKRGGPQGRDRDQRQRDDRAARGKQPQ